MSRANPTTAPNVATGRKHGSAVVTLARGYQCSGQADRSCRERENTGRHTDSHNNRITKQLIVGESIDGESMAVS
jgi:hypothetical protein